MTMFESMEAARVEAAFRVVEPLDLPAHCGTTFRGALGFAFKRVSCALPRQQCGACLLRERCAYSVCFETPVPEDAAIMRKYPFAPHPFVLEPPEDDGRAYAPGESLTMGLTLVGRGNEYLPQFIYAFEEMGNAGLGRERAKLELEGISEARDGERRKVYGHGEAKLTHEPERIGADAVNERAAALAGKPFRIVFETPTRLKVRGRYGLVKELSDLLPTLLRRLNALHYFHCGGPEGFDVHPLIEESREVPLLHDSLRWVDFGRYSSRQKTRMRMGGFTGELAFGPASEPIMTALAWAERLHIGKASAFGFGRCRVEGDATPRRCRPT